MTEEHFCPQQTFSARPHYMKMCIQKFFPSVINHLKSATAKQKKEMSSDCCFSLVYSRSHGIQLCRCILPFLLKSIKENPVSM